MIKFSWDIALSCNFKCRYCAGYRAIGERERRNGRPVEETEKAWKDIFEKYGECRVYVTGGEPFLYPAFAGTMRAVSKYHRLHITTNLSLPLDDFIASLDSGRVEINASFHPYHIDFRTFRDQVMRLKKAGFTCGTCYLAHPSQLREMRNYKKYFLDHGIELAITPFRGQYEGKTFPEGYSKEERDYIKTTVLWSRDRGDDFRLPEGMNGFIDGGEEMQLSKLTTGGSREKFCPAGSVFAVIAADGTVRRCSQESGAILGNIFQRNVLLFNEARPCPFACCKSGEINNYAAQAGS
ncbi:MAG: radical SAM protein [Endomicrobiales bacterium]